MLISAKNLFARTFDQYRSEDLEVYLTRSDLVDLASLAELTFRIGLHTTSRCCQSSTYIWATLCSPRLYILYFLSPFITYIEAETLVCHGKESIVAEHFLLSNVRNDEIMNYRSECLFTNYMPTSNFLMNNSISLGESCHLRLDMCTLAHLASSSRPFLR